MYIIHVILCLVFVLCCGTSMCVDGTLGVDNAILSVSQTVTRYVCGAWNDDSHDTTCSIWCVISSIPEVWSNDGPY